jgi:2-oxoisovalerate dehydrogenase E1 component
VVVPADDEAVENGESCCVITYGMGVHWAKNAAAAYPGRVEVVDLRTIYPCDEALVFETVQRHGKVLVLTEEQLRNSFVEALAGRIAQACFRYLDAPVQTMGALDLPAVPMNTALEAAMLPTLEKVQAKIGEVLAL